MSSIGQAQLADKALLAQAVPSHVAVSVAWPFCVDVPNTIIGTTDTLSPVRFEGSDTRVPPSSSSRLRLPNETVRQRRKREAYEERIEFLQEEARHDGYALNSASRRDFEQFALEAEDIRRAGLALLDNGNLRAIWRDGQGTRLGLQFLGGGRAQYVLFKRRTGEQPVSRVAGRDSLKGLERQLAAFDMGSLLYE